jgi:hypothetical protein
MGMNIRETIREQNTKAGWKLQGLYDISLKNTSHK